VTAEDPTVRIETRNVRRGIKNVEEEVRRGTVHAVIENDGGLDDLARKLDMAWDDVRSWGVAMENVPPKGTCPISLLLKNDPERSDKKYHRRLF